jgi:hypothetical protein
MSSPTHDERRSTSAACADHASDQLDQADDNRRQMDSMIAELEALLEEAGQLQTRYTLRKQGPETGS